MGGVRGTLLRRVGHEAPPHEQSPDPFGDRREHSRDLGVRRRGQRAEDDVAFPGRGGR